MPKVAKAYAINNARISFVSLVDKAANKHTFLVTKGDDGQASFQTYGDILEAVQKADEFHYVTGIVYEPMVEDTQGNYMTEEEITKAAYWYAENGNQVDIQHSFQPIDGVKVVESYVTKSDTEIGGKPVRKGSWVMTMKIDDPAVFAAIQKGEITGFSMGGRGEYSAEDVQLPEGDPLEKSEKFQGIRRKIASMFGLHESGEPVSKGAADKEIKKAGKAMSKANVEKLRGVYDSLGDFLSNFEESKESEGGEVTKAEVEQIVSDAIQKAMNPGTLQKAAPAAAVGEANAAGETSTGEVAKADDGKSGAAGGPITREEVQQMINAAISKISKSESAEVEKADDLQKVIEEAVAKAMEPVLKSTGLPTNLNNTTVQKNDEEECYLHGIL